jgi:hypothetical protein
MKLQAEKSTLVACWMAIVSLGTNGPAFADGNNFKRAFIFGGARARADSVSQTP